MEIRLVVATLFAVTIAFSNGAKRDGVMRKIYALETSMHEDMSYLRDAVDTNRVSIDAILQLLNNSQSGAVVNQQQPEANNDPYDDVRFSEELARFKRAFADEKAIAREQQANLMLGMSKLSDAMSKHLDGITDVVSKLDNRLDGISDDVSKLNNRLDGITDEVSKLENKLDGITDDVSKLDNKLDGLTDDVSKLDNKLDGLTDDVSKLDNKLDGLTDDVSKLDNKLDGLTDDVSKLDNKLDGLTDDVSKLDNKLDGLTDDVSKLDNKLDGLTDDVSKLDNKLDGITDNVLNLDSRLTKMEQDIAQNKADLNEKVAHESERLYANISSRITSSTSNTVDAVKVNVANVVGHMEQTVLDNINSSCNQNAQTIFEGQEKHTRFLSALLRTAYCSKLPAIKEVYSISLRTTRLANASCTHDGGVQGRVEVKHNGVWGTACDDVIDQNNNGATVVCRSLGFSSGIVKKEAYFGQGSGNIWLYGVKCDGTEDNIFDCPASSIRDFSSYCSHGEDVGVICS